MSILDVTEDQIFHTLGRGRDPNFKQIEKPRPPAPVVSKPKKTYAVDKPVYSQEVKVAEEPAPQPQTDESIKKLTEELSVLNSRVDAIQTMVKWYIVPQFMLIVALLIVLLMKTSLTQFL